MSNIGGNRKRTVREKESKGKGSQVFPFWEKASRTRVPKGEGGEKSSKRVTVEGKAMSLGKRKTVEIVRSGRASKGGQLSGRAKRKNSRVKPRGRFAFLRKYEMLMGKLRKDP